MRKKDHNKNKCNTTKKLNKQKRSFLIWKTIKYNFIFLTESFKNMTLIFLREYFA